MFVRVFAYMRAFDVQHHYCDDGKKELNSNFNTNHAPSHFFSLCIIILFHLFVSSSARNKMNDLMCNKDKKISGLIGIAASCYPWNTNLYVVQCILNWWNRWKTSQKITATTTATSAHSHKFSIKWEFKLLSRVISLNR